MAAGTYRHRITLQKPVASTNADGQVENTWQDVATIFARVEIRSAGEQIEHRQHRGFQQAVAVVRWSPTTTAIRQNWRFTFNAQTWNIQSAADLSGDRQEITLDAESRPGLA